MRRVAATIALLGTAAAVMAGMACGASEDQPAVAVDSVSPSSGTIGTEIVITGRGFDPTNNDVGFAVSALEGDRGYVTGVGSSDGRTIRVVLPKSLSPCPLFQDGACINIHYSMMLGATDITVHNRNGTSEPVPFTREMSPVEIARREVLASDAYAAVTSAFDRAEDDLWGPWSNFPAPYDFEVLEDADGEVYVSLSVTPLVLELTSDRVPKEIEGYELRLAEYPRVYGD